MAKDRDRRRDKRRRQRQHIDVEALGALVQQAFDLDTAAEQEVARFAPNSSSDAAAFLVRADYVRDRLIAVAHELQLTLNQSELSRLQVMMAIGAEQQAWMAVHADQKWDDMGYATLGGSPDTKLDFGSRLRKCRQLLKTATDIFNAPVILDELNLTAVVNGPTPGESSTPLFVQLKTPIVLANLSPTIDMREVIEATRLAWTPEARRERATEEMVATIGSQIITHIATAEGDDGLPRTSLLTLTDSERRLALQPGVGTSLSGAAVAPLSLSYQLLAWAGLPRTRALDRQRVDHGRRPGPQALAADNAEPVPSVSHVTLSNAIADEHARTAAQETSPSGLELVVNTRQGTKVLPVSTRDRRVLVSKYAVMLGGPAMDQLLHDAAQPNMGLFQLSIQDPHDRVLHPPEGDPRFRDGSTRVRAGQVRDAGTAPERGVEHLPRWAVFLAKAEPDGTFSQVRQVGLNTYARRAYMRKQELMSADHSGLSE